MATEEEIIKWFDEATDKKKAIKVIAKKSGISQEGLIKFLQRHGCKIPEGYEVIEEWSEDYIEETDAVKNAIAMNNMLDDMYEKLGFNDADQQIRMNLKAEFLMKRYPEDSIWDNIEAVMDTKIRNFGKIQVERDRTRNPINEYFMHEVKKILIPKPEPEPEPKKQQPYKTPLDRFTDGFGVIVAMKSPHLYRGYLNVVKQMKIANKKKQAENVIKNVLRVQTPQ